MSYGNCSPTGYNPSYGSPYAPMYNQNPAAPQRRIHPDNIGFGLYNQIQRFDEQYGSRDIRNGTLITRPQPCIGSCTDELAVISRSLERIGNELNELRALYFKQHNAIDGQGFAPNITSQQQVEKMFINKKTTK